MGEDDAIQTHLDLSRSFLATARHALEAGDLAPARFNTVHALELAVKGALVARLGESPRTHNVGGEFGKHFRAEAGADVTRRVNRILADYDGPRYPEWVVPPATVIEEDLRFVERLVLEVIPRLGQGHP